VRAFALGIGLVMLTGCGGARSADPDYSAEQAATCIGAANPEATSGSRVNSVPGRFLLVFGEDRYNYEGFILAVGYGPDAATASRRERRARSAITDKITGRPPAWGSSEGNVVYEAFGPSQLIGTANVLPKDVSRAQMDRLSEASSQGMREAVEKCLAEARRD